LKKKISLKSFGKKKEKLSFSSKPKSKLLIFISGVGKDEDGLLVLGATNLPWGLDPAMRRRFERRIYIPLPDYDGRLLLVKSNFNKVPHNLTEGDFSTIAKETEGLTLILIKSNSKIFFRFSGADISIFVRDVVFEPVRKIQSAQHFEEVNVNGQKKYKPVEESFKSRPNVKKITLVELNQDQLIIPEVSMVFLFDNQFKFLFYIKLRKM
jgi:vacuolar protein-sorting-associated protein 4